MFGRKWVLEFLLRNLGDVARRERFVDDDHLSVGIDSEVNDFVFNTLKYSLLCFALRDGSRCASVVISSPPFSSLDMP